MNRRWIHVLFWIIFVSVLGLSNWVSPLRRVWPALLLLAVGGLVVNYFVQVIRRRPMQSCGASRWWIRLILDHDSERPKRP